MSQRDQLDNRNNGSAEEKTTSEHYTSESSADIYNTPDVTRDSVLNEIPAQEAATTDVVVENKPVEGQTENAPAPYNYSPYNNNQYGNNPYNNQYNNNPYNSNPYGNNQYAGSPYGNGQYDNNPYSAGQYNNNRNSSNPYNSGQYGGNQYNSRNDSNPYNNSQYGNNQYNNNPYNNNPYGGQVPPNSNQYNPYMVPPQKSKNGLIIGIVIAVIVLFLIAVFALAYRAITLFSENSSRNRSSREEYRFDYDDDDWGKNRRQDDGYYDDDYYDDWYDDYDDYYDDYYDDNYYDDYYDEDSEYYSLDDDIRWDLSYSVEFDVYEDDGDIHDNAYIAILYPVIVGDDVPNLNRLNDEIEDEVDFLIGLSDDIEDDMELDIDAEAYVTYMDEEKLSIVFHEILYLSYEDGEIADVAYYLYSINFDMKNGVIMDNQNIIDADDDFSVDFRERSDIQNGEINYLTRMSDQEITDFFNSSDIIIFYTPMGMEIGFNYDQGWVTVTYTDYEQYLKVF